MHWSPAVNSLSESESCFIIKTNVCCSHHVTFSLSYYFLCSQHAGLFVLIVINSIVTNTIFASMCAV